MTKDSVAKGSQVPNRGIPTFDLAEKITSIIPVKVQPSLKKAVKHVTDNVSEFARQAIIEKLQRMEEESFE